MSTEMTVEETLQAVSDPDKRSELLLGGGIDEAAPIEGEEQVPAEPEQAETTEGAEEVIEDKGMVPSGRLKKATEQRRALEAENAQMKGRMEQMEALLQELLAGTQQPQEEQERSLVADDPEIKRLDKEREQDLQHRLVSEYKHDIQLAQMRIERDTPDFMDAYKYMVNFLAEDMADARGGTVEEFVSQAVQQVDRMAFNQYTANNQDANNAARFVYERAKRFGYRPDVQDEPQYTGPNLDAISRNAERSGKPNSERVVADEDTSIDGLLNKYKRSDRKNGRLDYGAIMKDIQRKRQNA